MQSYFTLVVLLFHCIAVAHHITIRMDYRVWIYGMKKATGGGMVFNENASISIVFSYGVWIWAVTIYWHFWNYFINV